MYIKDLKFLGFHIAVGNKVLGPKGQIVKSFLAYETKLEKIENAVEIKHSRF